MTGPEDNMGYGAASELGIAVTTETRLPLGIFPLGVAVGYGVAVESEYVKKSCGPLNIC